MQNMEKMGSMTRDIFRCIFFGEHDDLPADLGLKENTWMGRSWFRLPEPELKIFLLLAFVDKNDVTDRYII